MIIEKKEDYILIKNKNVIDKIPIDEENEQYQLIKEETNNFTENMVRKSEEEMFRQRIDELELYILLKEGLV